MVDICPNCGSHRRHESLIPCHDPWHNANTEMVFSFPLPGPHYSKTVSETQLREAIYAVRHNTFYSDAHVILALATERMIEMAKAPKLKPSSVTALDPSKPIRGQIEDMLLYIGLEPDRFLTKRPDSPFNYGLKEPSKVCDPEKVSKPDAERAATELALMLRTDLSIDVTPTILRLWLIDRWEKVAKLAHKIHGSA